ncbi:MAG: hypothetical protein ACRBDI_09745 [Alphaproteobacteria bacterium]
MAILIQGDDNKKDNEITLETKDQQQPEQVNNLEPAKPAETAGLSADQLGMGAKQTSRLQDPTNPENSRQGPDAQTLNNQIQSEETVFTASPHSNEVAFDQINKGLQGAAEGHVAGVMGSEIETFALKEEKRRKDARAALAYANIMSQEDLFKAFDELDDKVDETINRAQEIIDRLNASYIEVRDYTWAAAAEHVEELTKLQEMQRELKSAQDELAAMKASGNASPEEIAARQAEIDAQQEAVDRQQIISNGASATYEALATQLTKIEAERTALAQSITNIIEERSDLKRKLNSGELSEEECAQAQARLEAIEIERQELDRQSVEAEIRAKEQMKIAETIKDRMKDGNINISDIKELQNMAKDDPKLMGFIADIGEASLAKGITVTDADGNFVGKGDIKGLMLGEYDKIIKEQIAVEEQIDTSSAELAALKLQIDQAKQTLQTEQSELSDAQAALKTEQAQTTQATTDAQSITAIMSQYDDIQDYMQKNYSIGGIGDGEDIGAVAQDESRILKDSGGNFVYMSSENQALYTLAKNEDGSIKLVDGEQVKQELSVEEALSLQSKMYAEKLVPRNFVRDDAFPERSTGKDTFGRTLISSMTGMEKGEQQANIDAAIEEQKRQELAAQDAEGQASQELADAQNAVSEQQRNVTNTQATITSLEQQYAALLEKEEALKQEALANNIDLEAESKTAQTEESNSDTALAENTEMETPAPAYDHDHSVYLGKLEQQIGNGTVSPEQLEELLAEAPEGVDLDKVKADLEAKGMLTPEDQNDPQLAQNTLEDQPAPSNTISVTYPYLGATAQVQVIPAASIAPSNNGVSPAPYSSFADGPEFAATNDPKNPDATYSAPINNGTSNVVNASSSFGKSPVDQPAAGTGAPTPEQLATLEQERIQREALLQQQLQNQQLAQNDSKIAPTSGTGTGAGGIM